METMMETTDCFNSFLKEHLIKFKQSIEDAICKNGVEGKNAIIRTSKPVNLIHDIVKKQLICNGVDPKCINPPLDYSSPEIKIAGWLKQKDQDIVAVPKGVSKVRTKINWGPLAYEDVFDEYGFDFTEKSLIINVRSQMSSLAKNSDTLFERTFAEPLNIHLKYTKAVLGEVFLIPVHEYDDLLAKNKVVGFKKNHVNIEKYISFFKAISDRNDELDKLYMYERCALLIVDFNRQTPFLYTTPEELKKDNLISSNFNLDFTSISLTNFSKDILNKYINRFGKNYIFK
ncbi:MAG: hypothetical protein ACI4ND_08085 [Succinivibrio sp.]